MSTETHENPVVAFFLVIAAGAASGIGASLVFFPRLVKLASRRTLAASLGVATGVMLYVSLVDIYGKAITGFSDSGYDEVTSFIYTTLTFFAGILLMMFLNKVVIGYFLMSCFSSDLHHHDGDATSNEPSKPQGNAAIRRGTSFDSSTPDEEDEENDFCLRPTSAEHYDDIQYMADQVQPRASPQVSIGGEVQDAPNVEERATDEESKHKEINDGKLMHMGIATALAIALHNLPEGLVTFVAYTSDPTVGIVLCIGIALHNIPEGVVVSMPIYYATGNRRKAFFWGILSGISEPLGALIGWLVLSNSGFSGTTYGILFGLVSGIMVYISIDDLLPTAVSYDPKNTLVTYSVIFGMFIIAASLILFSV